jgi:hypothetical protein
MRRVLGECRYIEIPPDLLVPQPRESPKVVMPVNLLPIDRSAVRLKNSANVKGLTEKLAGHMNCVVARSSRAGLG